MGCLCFGYTDINTCLKNESKGKNLIMLTIHKWVLHAMTAPNPTRYDKNNKYTVKANKSQLVRNGVLGGGGLQVAAALAAIIIATITMCLYFGAAQAREVLIHLWAVPSVCTTWQIQISNHIYIYIYVYTSVSSYIYNIYICV